MKRRESRDLTSRPTERDSVQERLRLVPELVPKPLWGVSAYTLLRGTPTWKHIREAALREAGHRCAVCGSAGPPAGFTDRRLYCHEVWSYDDRTGVATLEGFRMLCSGCNAVVHLGRTSAVGQRQQALVHLSRVNRTSEPVAVRIADRAMQVWQRRSGRDWKITVSERLRAAYPELNMLEGRTAPASRAVQASRPAPALRRTCSEAAEQSAGGTHEASARGRRQT